MLFQLYGRRAPWEDPAKWVMDTYPWAATPQHHEWPPLLQLRPEDVGFDGYSMSREGSTSKQVPVSDAEGDPLVSSRFFKTASFPLFLGIRNGNYKVKDSRGVFRSLGMRRQHFWGSHHVSLRNAFAQKAHTVLQEAVREAFQAHLLRIF